MGSVRIEVIENHRAEMCAGSILMHRTSYARAHQPAEKFDLMRPRTAQVEMAAVCAIARSSV
ncbi:MAG: hypothetical protein ACI9BW_003836 [Gammaproteobacteria bacterium]|jgi:hypothetical protein